MDADGLPLVGPGVDYTKVECINQKRMVAFLNHFVSHTAGFLNRFSCVCEEKLEHLSHRMQQLEITMNLLEAKISSIPGLENVTAASSSTTGSSTSTSDGAGASAPPAPPPPSGTEPQPQAEQPSGETVPPAPPAEEPFASNPVSQDPRFVKYFKMVKMGVPESAVKMKMSAEGLNPDLLDDPDAPAPAGGEADNDDDFSDSSDNQSDDSDDFD